MELLLIIKVIKIILFENSKLNNLALPMNIVRMLTTINQYNGKKDLYIWLEYFFGIIIKAYKELEDRVGCIENTKGSKSERIKIS